MIEKLSNEQLTRIALHATGISNVLLEAFLSSENVDTQTETSLEELVEIFVDEPDKRPFMQKEEPLPPFEPDFDWNDADRREQERVMSRLCGRWTSGSNRCGIEISRAGKHFILTYLKRNGCPTDERYILVWLDGDILYYGHEDRITVLGHNADNDTLMVSPGADYTRVPKGKK